MTNGSTPHTITTVATLAPARPHHTYCSTRRHRTPPCSSLWGAIVSTVGKVRVGLVLDQDGAPSDKELWKVRPHR